MSRSWIALFITVILFIVGNLVIDIALFKKGQKSGYEKAVKDFTVGKLRCDYIDGKIIWKE